MYFLPSYEPVSHHALERSLLSWSDHLSSTGDKFSSEPSRTTGVMLAGLNRLISGAVLADQAAMYFSPIVSQAVCSHWSVTLGCLSWNFSSMAFWARSRAVSPNDVKWPM